jgi:hypothetical protein
MLQTLFTVLKTGKPLPPSFRYPRAEFPGLPDDIERCILLPRLVKISTCFAAPSANGMRRKGWDCARAARAWKQRGGARLEIDSCQSNWGQLGVRTSFGTSRFSGCRDFRRPNPSLSLSLSCCCLVFLFLGL